MTYTICGEDRADASTVTTVLNGWHSADPVMPANTLRCYSTKNFTRVQELLVPECVLDKQEHDSVVKVLQDHLSIIVKYVSDMSDYNESVAYNFEYVKDISEKY